MEALTDEKNQVKVQCDQMAEAQTGSQTEIRQLKVANERLQQENDQLRQELLAARATPRPLNLAPASLTPSTTSGPFAREEVDRLDRDGKRLWKERKVLQDRNKELEATIVRLRQDDLVAQIQQLEAIIARLKKAVQTTK